MCIDINLFLSSWKICRRCIRKLIVLREALHLSVPVLFLWSSRFFRVVIDLADPIHLDVLEILHATYIVDVVKDLVVELFHCIVGLVLIEFKLAGKREILELG